NLFFFFQAEDGIRDRNVTGVQTCALPIYPSLTGGQLYYSFTSPTKYRGEVISSVTYDVNGIYRLDGITFLPKAEYTGSVVIPYEIGRASCREREKRTAET